MKNKVKIIKNIEINKKKEYLSNENFKVQNHLFYDKNILDDSQSKAKINEFSIFENCLGKENLFDKVLKQVKEKNQSKKNKGPNENLYHMSENINEKPQNRIVIQAEVPERSFEVNNDKNFSLFASIDKSEKNVVEKVSKKKVQEIYENEIKNFEGKKEVKPVQKISYNKNKKQKDDSISKINKHSNKKKIISDDKDFKLIREKEEENDKMMDLYKDIYNSKKIKICITVTRNLRKVKQEL